MRRGHATFRDFLPPLTANQWHLPLAGAKENRTLNGRRVLGALNHNRPRLPFIPSWQKCRVFLYHLPLAEVARIMTKGDYPPHGRTTAKTACVSAGFPWHEACVRMEEPESGSEA